MARRNAPGPLSRAISALLDSERETQGLTQTALGAISGISQSQVSKLLRAERVFTVDDLDRLCTALGLDIVDVVRAASSR